MCKNNIYTSIHVRVHTSSIEIIIIDGERTPYFFVFNPLLRLRSRLPKPTRQKNDAYPSLLRSCAISYVLYIHKRIRSEHSPRAFCPFRCDCSSSLFPSSPFSAQRDRASSVVTKLNRITGRPPYTYTCVIYNIFIFIFNCKLYRSNRLARS
jgi:hypothetical protein